MGTSITIRHFDLVILRRTVPKASHELIREIIKERQESLFRTWLHHQSALTLEWVRRLDVLKDNLPNHLYGPNLIGGLYLIVLWRG